MRFINTFNKRLFWGIWILFLTIFILIYNNFFGLREYEKVLGFWSPIFTISGLLFALYNQTEIQSRVNLLTSTKLSTYVSVCRDFCLIIQTLAEGSWNQQTCKRLANELTTLNRVLKECAKCCKSGDSKTFTNLAKEISASRLQFSLKGTGSKSELNEKGFKETLSKLEDLISKFS